MHTHMSIAIHTHANTQAHVHNTHMHTHKHTCSYIHTHIHTCTHIHTQFACCLGSPFSEPAEEGNNSEAAASSSHLSFLWAGSTLPSILESTPFPPAGCAGGPATMFLSSSSLSPSVIKPLRVSPGFCPESSRTSRQREEGAVSYSTALQTVYTQKGLYSSVSRLRSRTCTSPPSAYGTELTSHRLCLPTHNRLLRNSTSHYVPKHRPPSAKSTTSWSRGAGPFTRFSLPEAPHTLWYLSHEHFYVNYARNT